MPGAGRGEKFDRIVVLGGRRIFRIDDDVGRCECRLDIAGGRRFLDPFGDLGRVILGQPLRAEGRARRCRGVGHAYLAGGVPRRFKGLGENDGDDLAVVVDLGAELLRRCRSAAEGDGLEVARVLVGEDVEDAGHRPRFGEIECGDATLGDRAGHQVGEGGVAYRKVRRVTRLAGDFEPGHVPYLGL